LNSRLRVCDADHRARADASRQSDWNLAAYPEDGLPAAPGTQSRSGGRIQPTAQAVGRREIASAPEGRKNMSHTSGNILLHFIFSTRERRPLIKPEFRDDLFAYLGGIIREMNDTALIVNGVADHVHMLIRARPVQSASEITRVVKTNSSRWMREKHSQDFRWQSGYGVFSVSESSVAAVTEYIAGQEEHHKKHSFQEEFVAFLKKNHVEYDERYIWD
jgi:REP element-mobilizing transposase RayT